MFLNAGWACVWLSCTPTIVDLSHLTAVLLNYEGIITTEIFTGVPTIPITKPSTKQCEFRKSLRLSKNITTQNSKLILLGVVFSAVIFSFLWHVNCVCCHYLWVLPWGVSQHKTLITYHLKAEGPSSCLLVL